MFADTVKDAQLADVEQTWTVPEELTNQRLDKAISVLAEISRSQAKFAIEAGQISVDGKLITSARHAVSAPQRLSAACLARAVSNEEIVPRAIALEFIAKYPEFFVIAKPPGLVVHPARGHRNDTLANAVAACCPQAGLLPRAGVVHRLDKDTSGAMVVARTDFARRKLIEQFKHRRIKRKYLAIVHGRTPATGVINRPIGRNATNRIKMAVRGNGRDAYTRYQKIAETDCFSYLLCTIESGRTHQIRVHLEYAGHPVAGDRLYNRYARDESKLFPRQMLHACFLELSHPSSGDTLRFNCPLPHDFANAVKSFNWPVNHA